MNKHFNGLSPAEAERLAWLMEEMAEAQQVIGKILRHGYESRNPLDFTVPTNRRLLERELGDVMAAARSLFGTSDLNEDRVELRARSKERTVRQWMHHQEPTEEPTDG